MTWEGWACLATVIDLSSRKVVGWALADHMRTSLVEDALSMAFARRRPAGGVIFHSDRGCQYTSGDFAALARANGVILSVSRKGECWDNAVAESSLDSRSDMAVIPELGGRAPDDRMHFRGHEPRPDRSRDLCEFLPLSQDRDRLDYCDPSLSKRMAAV
jgi:transposase InsO family protein